MKKNVVFCCSLFVLSVGACRAEEQDQSSGSSSFFPTIEVSSDTNTTSANTPAEPPVDNLQDLHFPQVDPNGALPPLDVATTSPEVASSQVAQSLPTPPVNAPAPQTNTGSNADTSISVVVSTDAITDSASLTPAQQQELQQELSLIAQFLPETLQKALPTVITQLSSSAMLQLQSLGPIIAAPFLVYKAWANAKKVIEKEEGKNRRAAKMAAYASAAFLLVVNGYQWLAQQQ